MKTLPLGELVDFYSGGTPSRAEPALWSGEVPWFSAKDMKRNRLSDSRDHLSEKVFASTSLRKLPAGTVAIVVRGMILAHTVPISILDKPAAINQDLKALLPRRDLNVDFLAAMLRAQHQTILGQVSTAAHGTKKLDSRVLDQIQIPFPPLPEQRRIAAILDHADALRSKRRRALGHLDSLTQSLFNAMFGQEARKVSFGEVILSGPTNGLYRPSTDYGSGTPILRIDGFDSGSVKDQLWKRVRIDEKERDRYALTVGDVVINRVNALSHLGKSAIVEGIDEPSVYESNMMRIRVNPDLAIPRFVISWLQTSSVRHQILAKAKKAINQASVNQQDVRSLVMPMPEMDRQRAFSEAAQEVDARRAQASRARACTEELFASLQARAFQGTLG